MQNKLYLGNLSASRDWGHARDYAEGMWLILQQPEPDDYVLATGEEHSVREFVEKAFACVGRTIVWKGADGDEKGMDRDSGKVLIEVDPRYFRPTEVEALIGDPRKAHNKLGWRHRVTFDELVQDMVKSDLEAVRFEQQRHGRSD
jgi:GDPmannose 4,6-dehydratase